MTSVSGLVDPTPPAAWDRFWSKIDIGDCWRWTGGKNLKGYGLFHDPRLGQRRHSAHRWLWERLVGPIGVGLQLDHLCRNPGCVNPDHLEPVTPFINTMRGVGITRINIMKTHCPARHEYDEANTYVDKRGYRSCRTCRRECQRRYGPAQYRRRKMARRAAGGSTRAGGAM